MARSKKILVGSDDGTIYTVDTLEHEGKSWLVPEWLEAPTEGWRTPKYMICIDGLRRSGPTGPDYPAEWVLDDPIPKSVLDGETEDQFEVVHTPDIRIPIEH